MNHWSHESSGSMRCGFWNSKAPSAAVAVFLQTNARHATSSRKVRVTWSTRSFLLLQAVAEVSTRSAHMEAGAGSYDMVFAAQRRVAQAGLELYDKPADQAAFFAGYVALAKAAETKVEAQAKAGSVGPADLHQARYARADAEIQLLRAKARVKADKN